MRTSVKKKINVQQFLYAPTIYNNVHYSEQWLQLQHKSVWKYLEIKICENFLIRQWLLNDFSTTFSKNWALIALHINCASLVLVSRPLIKPDHNYLIVANDHHVSLCDDRWPKQHNLFWTTIKASWVSVTTTTTTLTINRLLLY